MSQHSNINASGISIIMPVKDAGKHLEASVHSILSQTHKTLELIIIDDHCSDQAIQQLDKSDPRLCIIDHQGIGIVDALNAGIAHSNFPYIARMDADDISLPKRLELQLELLTSNDDVQICGTKIELFRDNESLGKGYQLYQQWINDLTQPSEIAKNIFIESPIPHPTVMMHRNIWNELGGYEDTDWAEDYNLWLKAHSNHYCFAKPTEILLHWRDHDSRLSRVSNRYDKKSFINAKAYYLSRYYSNRKFRIWGSGPTGALVHDALLKNSAIVTDFIDVAPKRIGNQKRDKSIISAFEMIKTQDLILVAVSARGAREDIKRFLNNAGFIESQDYLCVA